MTDSRFRSQNYSEMDAAKKRPRSSQAHDEFIRQFSSEIETRPRGRPRVANKTPLSATHEIRQLRAQVASMEDELQQLQSKWSQELPDSHTLKVAQQSAREKHEVTQTETTQRELQGVLLQQQLMFATLQSALHHAPLHSSGLEIVKALHFNTQLSRDEEEREKSLLAHHARSLASMPSIVDKFVQVAIDKVIARREEEDMEKPVTPLSQIDVTGCSTFSLISSVFISEIPHTSLAEVYEAILKYFEDIPSWMDRHFGVDAKRKRLNSTDSLAQYWQLNLDGGSGVPATVNHVLSSELTNSYGVFHIDAITDDPLYPVSSTNMVQYGLNGIKITPRREPVTGEIISVTLKWLVVYRYKLLPDDPIIRDELENIRPILNGDLVTAVVCGYLQENQQSDHEKRGNLA